MQKGKWFLSAALAASVGLAGCGKTETVEPRQAAVGSGESLEEIVMEGLLENTILLRVNDRPVTQYDFNLWQLSTKQKETSPETQQELLDRIVEAELMYQRGIELGLDKDPAFVRAFALIAAKNKLLRLQEMEGMVTRHEANAIEVSDEEARAYYDANETSIRASYNFGSLQFQAGEEAKAAVERIRGGESFESVADEVVSGLPEFDSDREPKEYWAMEGITWRMIPPPVMSVVAAMEVGDVSEPIDLGESGHIVLKLIGKETLDEADFPSVRGEIIERLRGQAVREHLDELRRDLKARARVETLASPAEVDMAPVSGFH